MSPTSDWSAPADPDRRAVIVGAGIGGLAAALALRRAGWAVTVLERAAEARELGFALLMAPNAMRALRALGVADDVAARGVVASAGEIRRPNGRALRRMEFARLRKRLGEDTVCVLRSALHGTLLEALGDSPLFLGTRAISFAADDSGVTVTTEQGHVFRSRILIGADGIRSAVRTQVLGDHPLRPAGFTAWRGVARGVIDQLGGLSGAQYLGTGVEAGIARAGRDEVYWFLATAAPKDGGDPADGTHALEPYLRDFHAPFRAIVAATAPEALRRDDIYDRDPVHRWGDGPITLLGDAAHPMTPNAGQGAAQAIEDAVVLGRCLAAGDPVVGLRRYEQIRIPRTRAIVELSRRNARLLMIRSKLGIFLRDLALRTVPERVMLSQLVKMGRADLADA